MDTPELKDYLDIAPLNPIITKALGVFTDLEGKPNAMGESAIACNEALYEQVMRLLH